MRTRTWAIVVGVNVIVSALVILAVLFIWERVRTPAPTLPTPTLAQPATPGATSPATAQPVASPTPSGPLMYTVQAGDTLLAIARVYDISVEELMAANGLTDPNVLQVGQTLIVPFPTPTGNPPAETPAESSPPAEPLPTPLPTLTPSGPPLVEIAQVLGSGDPLAEVVIVRNRGGAISLDRWTLSDAEGNTFTFPALTLFADTQVSVHSTSGDSAPTDLYWGRTTPAWNGGELITLRDAPGNVVDTYIVP
jgi:LysM repeat protein